MLLQILVQLFNGLKTYKTLFHLGKKKKNNQRNVPNVKQESQLFASDK